MHTFRPRKAGSVHLGTVFQLFLSHLLVGICVLAGARFFPIILIVGGLVGVVCTLNISSNLYILELILDRLARKLPVESPSRAWRWPLTPLFFSLSTLEYSPGDSLQIEAQNAEYRDQLSLQVRKTAAQEERNRLARDLHDSIKQQIFGVVVSAAAAKARWENDPAGALRAIDDIESTAQEAQVEMQALLQELRPVALENVGLIEALRLQCQALGYRTGADVLGELTELPAEDLLPPGSQELLFRIVQEGFGNIARHARASKVWLSLRQQQDVFLVEIGDNGQGFSAEEKHQGYGGMGLKNIRERVHALGGDVSIWSKPGEGTTLHFSIPLVRETQKTRKVDQQFLTAVKQTQKSLGFGIKAAELGLALVLLYTPAQLAFVLLGGVLLVAMSLWIWSQRSLVQVALSNGSRSPEYRSLQGQSSALFAAIFLLWLVEPGYFAMISRNSLATLWFIVGIGICICVVLCLFAVIRYIIATRRYYLLLSASELRAVLRQKLSALGIEMLAWTVVAGCTFFIGHVQGYFDPLQFNSQMWISDTGLLFLVLWFCAILLRTLQALSRYQFIARKAA
ncbi:MAG TPA: sensor histidine kinase [Ktedonobacteraceae bacterium]|nr:sensor histidine kinase [Ktedonobacteraceae bacterium]